MPGFVLKATLTAALVLLTTVAPGVYASEFRRFNPIPVAPEQGKAAESETRVRRMPVPRHIVERGVREIVEAWNGPDLESLISDRAYDKYRLLDAVDGYAPRDATLRLLSLEDVQTLRQYREEGGGEYGHLVSEVAVDLVTQVEFEDPARGFQRRTGTIELILEVRQPLVPPGEGTR